MSDGEVLYLALCGGAALAFILSLVYVTSVASGARDRIYAAGFQCLTCR